MPDLFSDPTPQAGYGDTTDAASPDVAIANQTRRAMAQQQAQLQLEQQRAILEQTRNQQQGQQVNRALAGQTAESDAAQWAGTPGYTGQSWSATAPEVRQHFMDAYSTTPQGTTGVAADLPRIWNQAQVNATGNPEIGLESLQPGQTAQVDVNGNKVALGKPPKYQTDPQTGRLYQIDPQTGEPSYVQIGDQGPQGSLGEAPLAGDDFLQSIDPDTARNVKAIAEGRQNINIYPRQQQQRINAMVQQYDPSADKSTMTKRAALFRDFTSGKSANAIRSADTSIAHLNELNDLIPKLGNSDTPFVNPTRNLVRNWTSGEFNKNEKAFSETADLLSEELAKFYGTATIPAVANIKKSFDPNLPPATLKNNVIQAVKLLGDQMKNYRAQYESAAGQKQAIPFLTKDSRDTLVKLGIDPNTVDEGAPKGEDTAATPSPSQPTAAQNIRVKLPDGTEGVIPAAKLEAAKQRGAKPL